MSKEIVTPIFRVGFCKNVFTPDVVEDEKTKEKKESYSVEAVFKPDALRSPEFVSIVDAIKATALAQWQEVPSALIMPFKTSYTTGNVPAGFEEGDKFMRFTTKFAPNVVQKTPLGLEKVTDPSVIYSGLWCRAVISPYASGGRGTKYPPRVNFNLLTLMKVKDDTPTYSANDHTDLLSQYA